MISPLRRRHRWLAPLCFFGAAGGLVLGVMARPKAFIAEGSRPGSLLRAPEAVRSAAQRVSALDGLSVAVLAEGGAASRTLWLLAEERLEAADILAYLSADAAGDSLPGDARLLGPVAPLGATRLPLPVDAPTALTLFSLGQQRILVTLRIADLESEAR